MRKLILVLLLALTAAKAQNPNTAAFPTAVATDADLLVANNSARSNLTADILAGDTAIPVADGTKFVAPTVVAIGGEAIKICSISVNTLNVCTSGRGFHGSAAGHANGTAVVTYVDQHFTNQLAAEVKAVESALGAGMANVVQPSGSYSNPAWLTALAWAKLTGVPGTFAPSAHASAHAGAGGDPVTSLGAFTLTGTVTPGVNNTYDLGTSGAQIKDTYVAGIRHGTHEASWAWQDNYLALPTGTSYIQWGVFTPRLATATITEVWCKADTSDAVIQLRRSDGNDMVTSNLACGASGNNSTTINSYGAISVGQNVGMYAVSGTAKSIQVGIKFTN